MRDSTELQIFHGISYFELRRMLIYINIYDLLIAKNEQSQINEHCKDMPCFK